MSLPTPPSGILDKDRPWYRGKISDAQWDRLKAKLTGGTDAGGTSYSKFIDCSVSEADKIISNLKKDPRGYPQMYMPGGGESYQIMIDFYQWLKDSYLYDDPKPEPEEIPVEVEVVEVEQKTVDEPIIVKIEAPFEPTPEVKLSAPKRIRVPRRSGIVTPRVKKQSVADRMAQGFTENLLDPLLDSIQNPPAPAPPKQRKQKETLVKIKKAVKPTSSKFKSNYRETGNVKPFENLTAFLGNKVRSGLGRAADARRMATEMGMPEQKRGFYAKRALGFEFGGDAIARTRGTFAKSPDATLDPSLTKQQRYVQGMFGTRTIRGASSFDKKIDGISKKFDGLQKNFQDVINTKKKSPSSSETVDEFNKTVEEIRDALKKGNKLQKGINEAKKDQAKLAADAANDAEMAAKEAAMEQKEDNAFLKGIEKPEQKKEEKKDGGGFNPFDFLKRFKGLKKWFRRLKNPRKTLQAIKRLTKQKLKKIPGVRQLNNWMKAKKPFQGLRNMFGGNKAGAAAKTAKTADAAADVTKAVKAVDATGDAARAGGFFSRMLGPLSGLSRNPLVRAGSRFTGKALPIIGTVAAVSTTKDRYAKMNDPEFQKMVQEKKERGETLTEEELYSNPLGVAIAAISGIPIAGLPALAAETLMGTDAVQQYAYKLERDRETKVDRTLEGIGLSSGEPRSIMPSDGSIPEITQGSDNRNIFQKMMDGYNDFIYGTNKMSEGGTVKLAAGGVNAMTGEAGNELIIDPRSGGYNPLQSLAPIIVAMRELTKRSGPWAGPIYNFVKQTTDPIAKELNLPVTPVKSSLGGVGGEKKELKMISRGGDGGFGGILDAIGALFGGGGSVAAPQSSGGFQGATLSGSAAQLIGNDTEFLAEVTRVCRKFGIKEGDLLGLMASESGFNPAEDNGTHVGLIQFSRDSARAVGTTQAALKGMTRAQQMTYVEKYFDHWKSAGYFPDNPTAGQLYSVVFAPAYANKQDHEALYSAGSAAYNSNRPLDTNNDGQITMAEMGQRIQRKKDEFGISDSDSGPVFAPPPAQPQQPPTITPPRPQTTPPAPAQSSQGTPKIDILSMPGLQPPPAPQPATAPLSAAEMNQVFRGASLSDIMRARLAQ